MRLIEKKFYTTYKVLRNNERNVVDLSFINQYDSLNGKQQTFKDNLNDSKKIVSHEKLKTYTSGKCEYASFIDYRLERVKEYIIIDRVANKILKYDTIDKVQDYLLSITSTRYNNIYQYNKSNIIVLR